MQASLPHTFCSTAQGRNWALRLAKIPHAISPSQPSKNHLQVQSREGDINLAQSPSQPQPREQAHREGWKATTRTPPPNKSVEEDQMVNSTEYCGTKAGRKPGVCASSFAKMNYVNIDTCQWEGVLGVPKTNPRFSGLLRNTQDSA